MAEEEATKTGISSLKVAYNKVFGYYLEVRNTHRNLVPSEWIRKQTLVSAERYITKEIKEYEEKILQAESEIHRLETQYFEGILLFTCEYILYLQENAQLIAYLDCIVSFAHTAINFNYTRPKIDDAKVLDLKAVRHPVIERHLPVGEPYVPNDVYLDDEKQQVMVITGPNMSGKSALLRQTALVSIMAQMGSYVPAESAHIGVVDKIFTRVGASDNLARGESTFMVEMIETASILNNLGERSLILMDEIGRGTSTYDGISIAWAIVEYLHNYAKQKPRTLFATHYHELSELEGQLKRLKNYNVSVKETPEKIIFVRKLEQGSAHRSFGINVAKMAGIPHDIVLRARQILSKLEQEQKTPSIGKDIKEIPPQMPLFDTTAWKDKYIQLSKKFESIDPNALSPIEGLIKLSEIKKWVEENQ